MQLAGAHYFPRQPNDPAPLTCAVRRRVRFNEVDVMGIVWYGRHAVYCEEAAAELGRQCGLSYADYQAANLRAAIVRFTVDYARPLHLDEHMTVRATMVWTEAARINTEYEILKEDGRLAATACTVQLLLSGADGSVCFVVPPLLERCRRRWKAGEFACLQ
jgi:acyl-CoA thioester hydrolase